MHRRQAFKYELLPNLCRLLTAWRNRAETPWLKDAPTHPLQQTLKDLERAYRNFFEKRANFPRFKKKGRREPTGLQAGVERRTPDCRAAAEHEPDLSGLRACVGG